jgi:centromeric protein E
MESKINVTVRIKPLSDSEKGQEKNHLWNLVGENTLMNVRTKEMFTFDNIFGEKAVTLDIFHGQVKEQVITALQGINVTVFAYGQTSSGKTFTMRGSDKCLGLIPLSIQEVFDTINNDHLRKYTISVSYLEVS